MLIYLNIKNILKSDTVALLRDDVSGGRRDDIFGGVFVGSPVVWA